MKKINSLFFEIVSVLVPAIAMICLLFTFCFRLVGVHQSSMVDTLHDGDWLLVMPYYSEPAYGDIIISTQENDAEDNLVKRVIATEGQTVDRLEDGTFTVDGEPLEELSYINGDASSNIRGDVSFPLTVPEGCVFVCGDNRSISFDSRYSGVGFVQTDYLLGKAMVRLSTDWNIYDNFHS